MGIFDNNIHMNGAGTTYQSFLDLAGEAEQKGGKIGDRTVRLVKAGDGLATTTFHGSKGARADQIMGARTAFLNAIAQEFGYAARGIAEKTLCDGNEHVPLTARTIRSVDEALGNKASLAKSSDLVLKNKVEFDLAITAVNIDYSQRLGLDGFRIDRARVQDEALRLIGYGKFPADKEGLKKAIFKVAAPRVAVAMRIEPLLRASGVPEHLVRRVAATALDEAAAVLDDYSITSPKDVASKIDAVALKCLENAQNIFACEALGAKAVQDAEDLMKTMLGNDIMETGEARNAMDGLKEALESLKDENPSVKQFEAKCEKAVALHVKTCIVRLVGAQMMVPDGTNPAFARIGSRLYDALGVEKDKRIVDGDTIMDMEKTDFTTRYDLEKMGPAELRSLAARVVFQAVATDCAKILPKPVNAHPLLSMSNVSLPLTVANDLLDRFEAAATDEDFAKLADDFKTLYASRREEINASLSNIDRARAEAKAELGKQLEAIAAAHGIQPTAASRSMLDRMLSEATDKLQSSAIDARRLFEVAGCKAKILERVESKFLQPCRHAAAEIEASKLDPAHKKAFIAKLMSDRIDMLHVKIAIRAVPEFDAGDLAAAAKSGDGAKLAHGFFQFVSKINASIRPDENAAIYGAEEYSAFVATATHLLFILNPEIADGVRNLDAAAREKMFDDAAEEGMNKSREIQEQQARSPVMDEELYMKAKHWSSANSCIMQLHQEVSQG